MDASENDLQTSSACGDSAGGYPHGLAIHTRAFNQFLDRYSRHYRLGRTVKPSDAWLPVRWDTVRETGSSVTAALEPFRLEFNSDSQEAQLLFRLGAGTFTADGQQFPTNEWTFRLVVPWEMAPVKTRTDDRYPYYAKAFERINARWNETHRLGLVLGKLASGADRLDVRDANLSKGQRAELHAHIDLLAGSIRKRDVFVLLYLGSDIKLEAAGAEVLDEASPPSTWSRAYIHPYGPFAATARDGEIHLSYGSLSCPGRGPGGFSRPIVPDAVEGSFSLARKNVLAVMSRFSELHAQFEGGKVISILSVGHAKRALDMNVMTITRLDGPADLLLTLNFLYQDTFQVPVLTSNEIVAVKLTHTATRIYEAALRFDGSAIVCRTQRSDRPRDPDKWLWTQGGVEYNLEEKMPGMLECIKVGALHPHVKNALKDLCGSHPIACKHLEVMEKMIADGHAIFRYIETAREEGVRSLELALDEDNLFVQLPEPFTYQRLQFDDHWNLCFDLRMVR